MARRTDSSRFINISVVGLSGSERDKGHAGVGKSCLCNRFMRSHADDYNVDHISVLSQSDFSGRVVNNDHFLYWGEVLKKSEEGVDYHFSLIEQTEFIDDASFQSFKGGKMEPYVKRCSATKITSAEKLMYICKNQLGIEKEYEQKFLPDGKFSVDGFVCVFDVSVVPNRSIEKQVEIVAAILSNLLKTKKPIVLVTTKNDDADPGYLRELDRLLQRKEYKGVLPLVESSAHENVNVDQAFILLAQMIDKCKFRTKILSYLEAARMRKEMMDAASESFMRLIRLHITNYHTTWSQTIKILNAHNEWIYFVQVFGLDGTQRLFRRHIKMLKEEQVAKRVAQYMDMLPDILHKLNADTDPDCDWNLIKRNLKSHPEFYQFFYECPEDIPWTECELESDNEETRIPINVLDTNDAETVFKNYVNLLQQEKQQSEMPKRWKRQFKQLLEDTGYVTPGKPLSEVRVLFMGRECFEALSEHDCQQIYDAHQRQIIERAKYNFQELLFEHANIFYNLKSMTPTGTISPEDIKEIVQVLQDDFRYKILDKLDQDRRMILYQHLDFIHCPIKEHCPSYPNCMDVLIEKTLTTRSRRPPSWCHGGQCFFNLDDNKINILILGVHNIAEDFLSKIRSQCEDDEYKIDCQFYSLDYRIICGDVDLPQHSFKTSDFVPHGGFCVFSDAKSFEYIRESLEKTLVSNLEQEDKLPFQGLPILLLFLQGLSLDPENVIKLKEEGQNLADSLQCTFMHVCTDQISTDELVSESLHQLVQSIHERSGFPSLNFYQPVIDCLEPDIRIIMSLFCGDEYSVESILSPFLSHQCCFMSSERSVILETFLGDSRRRVEIIVSSFHGANSFRDELVHGFILTYSIKRKASLATLNAFSMNIPNLPIQILAVTDVGGANAFFTNDLAHLLITEGNATADRLNAHFNTFSACVSQKTTFYTPFFKEVWEKKPEIEQAFHMEDPSTLDDIDYHSLPEHPIPPPRHESYNLKLSDGNASDHYFYSGPEDRHSSSDHSDKYSIYQYNIENDIPRKEQRYHHSKPRKSKRNV